MPVAESSPPLSRLRSDLARLRRRRSVVRLGSTAAVTGLILIAAAAFAFAVDYLTDLRAGQRAAALVGIFAAAGWAVRRLVQPLPGRRETETDVALLVERQQGLEGDLVAALQFQSPEASAWGSTQLERAVVGYVDEASHELSVFEGFRWKPLPGWLALGFAALVAAGALAASFPGYSAAFVSRLMLTDMPYPTRTIIASVSLNGEAIDLDVDTPLTAAAGVPLVFAATTGGERPASGEVVLESAGGGSTAVPLKANRSSAFVGTLGSFTESVTFTARLGDAETAPRRIELIPLPAVTIDLKPTPPGYARENAPAPPPPGVRTAFVLEGSEIGVTVRAANKPLERVMLSVGSRSFPLKASADLREWRLPIAGTPLADVRESIDFVVVATDAHGLSTAEPLKGSIRIRPDRAPRVAAGAVVRRVLPTGRPELTYGAADDYGVKAVAAKVSMSRADGTTVERTISLPAERGADGEVRGRHPLDLSALGLAKGETVVVTVEATDARGERPGETTAADPITFEVTDREGLIASLLETDEEGAERLDEIIRRELGIGGGR